METFNTFVDCDKGFSGKGLIYSGSQEVGGKQSCSTNSSELSPYHLAGSGQEARGLVVNKTVAGHWPCPGTPSPVGGPQTAKDTSEILFNYSRAECWGREG